MVDPLRVLSVHHVGLRSLEHLVTHRRHCKKGDTREISESLSNISGVLKTFGWSDGTLVLFNLWGVVMFFIFSPVSAYLLSVSLRYSVLGGTFLVFLGSTLRYAQKYVLSESF